MVPSQKAREKALKRTSQQGISRVYTIIGGGVLVIGIIFALFPVALDISSRTKYGFATDDVITATIILELMGLFLALTGVIFIVVGKYAIKSAEKALSKGEINYPAAESKHTKEQLLQEAATIGQGKHNPLLRQGRLIVKKVATCPLFMCSTKTVNL